MKRTLFIIIALLLATPALGTLTITCTDEGGIVRIDYIVTGEAAKVRAFGLDVSLDSNSTIENVTNFTTGEVTGTVYFQARLTSPM